MVRKYPRFLLSNLTKNKTKSTGPFIIHTLTPQFIARPEFDEKRNLYDCTLIEVWDEEHDPFEVRQIMKDIPAWFETTGRLYSDHEEDELLITVSQMEFLLNYREEYTVEEARRLIRVLFPTKANKVYELSSSYGLKHLFEKVSMNVIGGRSANKYCGNDTVKEAFEKEGFRFVQDGPNRFLNLSPKEAKRAFKLFR